MEFVEHLKSSVDIVRVVGEYVRLRKTGPSRYSGLCPFHTEKTPSFSVHAAHQFYKCFGCGVGGDVLKFIQEIEGVSFFEALKLLAERYGIPMPKRSDYADPETRQRAALYQMHEAAEQVFREHLASPAGGEARAYLAKRGVSAEIASHFALGYSDRSGSWLARLLASRGFTPDQLADSGLVGRRDDGSFYDRFRHRLMFPIHSESGKVIGFGGRALDPNEQAKYLNSPETPIYKKSHVLYNLQRAKNEIRKSDRAVLVEGYMDVIGVWAAGIHEVVASCGTALTPQQVRMMKRHSEKIVVNFDPDAAGANAAERSINMLLEEGMHLRVLELDGGLDPDEYCKERGADAYRSRLDGASGYFYWLADRARVKFGNSAEGRVAGLQFLLPAIQRLGDKIERLTVANDIAGYLGVEPGAILESFRKFAAERRESRMEVPVEPVRPVEKLLLNILLSNEDVRLRLAPQLKEMPEVRQLQTAPIFNTLIALHEAGGRVAFAEIHDRLDEGGRALLVSAVLGDETDPAQLSLEQGMACIAKLQESGKQNQKIQLRLRVKEAERAGRIEEALRLAEELQRAERNS